MIQVFLTTHNVMIYRLIHLPQKFCISLLHQNLFRHLERFPAMIAALATSLGPWGIIPRVPNPLATCYSRARFPMDTGDNCTITCNFGW